jgi:hypothetical protein
MDGEMLGAGGGQHVFFAPLEALHERHAHAGREKRAFTVCFLSPAPAGVAENVDVRCPERQAEVLLAAVPFAIGLVMLGPAFGGDGVGDFLHEAFVPHGRQRDRLRKHRRHARPANTVQTLVPPVVRRNTQPLDGRREVHHLADLFLQRHPRHQIGCPLLERQGGVQVGGPFGRGGGFFHRLLRRLFYDLLRDGFLHGLFSGG